MEQVRVDPAVLREVAGELGRLAARVAEAKDGAQASVGVGMFRLGKLSDAVGGQWRAAALGLSRLEDDYRRLQEALGVLADYFAELDRRAVP